MAGQNAQIRIGFEVSEGLPGSDMSFLPFTSEDLKMEYVSQSDPNIDPSGNEGESEILEAHGTGTIAGAFNSESPLKIRAHMQEYNEVSEVVSGVQLWELRDLDEVNDTPVAYYKDSMHAGVWRDEETDPSEYSALGMKASRMELSVQRGQYATLTHDFLFTRDTVSRKPHEQAVNAAWTGDIHVDGYPVLTDDYYKFKVPVGGGGALGVAKFVWGKGAGAYGTTEYTTAAVMDVMNADDTLSGNRKVPHRILIDPAGVFTAGDEFYLYPFALKAVSSTSTRPKLHGAAAEVAFTMGTTFTKRIEDFTLQQFVPREAKGGVGSIYDQFIGQPNEAKRAWEFGFSSTYLDRTFLNALRNNVPIAVYIKLYGAKIGATAEEDFAEWTLPQMKITDAGGGTIQNAGDNPQNPVFRAFGDTLCIEKWQNTIASITPP